MLRRYQPKNPDEDERNYLVIDSMYIIIQLRTKISVQNTW